LGKVSCYCREFDYLKLVVWMSITENRGGICSFCMWCGVWRYELYRQQFWIVQEIKSILHIIFLNF